MKTLLSTFCLLLLAACTPRAWLIDSGSKGTEGKIGYNLNMTPEERDKAVKSHIPCERFSITSDAVKTAGVQEIESLPTTVQPTSKVAENLGAQVNSPETLGAFKSFGRDAGTSVVKDDEAPPIDGSYGIVRFKCE